LWLRRCSYEIISRSGLRLETHMFLLFEWLWIIIKYHLIVYHLKQY
jgi:hypothetical protein